MTLKRKETEEEIIERKRNEYKKEYIKFLQLGEECIVVRDLDIHKLQNNEYWNNRIQRYMNKAQIALYNYDLLDPEILKQTGKQYLKEIFM